MPSLTFVLPHWLYWSTLVIFPLVAAALVRREARRNDAGRSNYFLAYLFLITAGFVGMHRFYLRSAWGLVFIPFFLAVLWTSAEVRDARELVSSARSESQHAEQVLTRTKGAAQRKPEGAEQRVAEADVVAKQTAEALGVAQAGLTAANGHARVAAILLGLLLLGDAIFFLPGLVRRARLHDAETEFAVAAHPMETAVPDSPVKPPGPGMGAIDWLVRMVGALVAYWSVLAVFAYYYEVTARYVFNSPTNWVHESMFLMFGMQYMLVGAYAYRDETHVRVDIVYSQLSARGRAVCDIITSFFFFLFAGTMLVTGWRFASDAMSVGEHSFTEWGIQYWPVKLMIPVGATLLLLQGLSRLVRDIATVVGKEA